MAPTPYTLYYSPISLCSYMLRYALAIRGLPKDGAEEIAIEEKEVDIHFKMEQMSEFYLTKINPKGKVPAITSPSLPHPMPDSRDITNYFSRTFPSLRPAGYEDQIDEMLDKIHAPLPYFILSFGGGHPADHVVKEFLPRIDGLLAREDLSEEYRRALEYKRSLHTGANLSVLLSQQSVSQAEKTMRKFLEYVDEKLPSAQGWLFGLQRPSAADAHVVALLARLQDVEREHLFTAKVREYAERAMGTVEWKGVMKGLRTTMCQG